MNKQIVPQDNLAYRFPVSIKGIIKNKNRFLLLKNDRREWEFPGGKLEPKESIEKCLTREIKEETDLTVKIDRFVDGWIYPIDKNVNVLILVFGCKLKNLRPLTISPEHKEAGWFTCQEIMKLNNMPSGYKQSVKRFGNLRQI